MENFWLTPSKELLSLLKSSLEGLSEEERTLRLKQYGLNNQKPPQKGVGLFLFLKQLDSPLQWILIFAATLSLFLRNPIDAMIILIIVFLSALLGYFQERGAIKATNKIISITKNKTRVRIQNNTVTLASENLVPGDIIILNAGDLVPADCILIETHHLFVDESAITGESLPAEKEETEGSKNRALFFGTQVISGYAIAIIVNTGKNTLYGHILESLSFRPPETAFEIGIRKFSYFLMQVTLILVLSIFFLDTLFGLPAIESFLFATALAVGLTPQLLPAIVSVNLAKGSKEMFEKKVLVKRLPSIENFGQMNILCTDKTGTITTGKLQFEKALTPFGAHSDRCLHYSLLNAHFQAGYTNPLDEALLSLKEPSEVKKFKKIDETPYDFIRKRLSVYLENDEKILITKGAFKQILSICTQIEKDEKIEPITTYVQEIETRYEELCNQGFRTLAIAYGNKNEESNLIFLGFLLFTDPIKPEGAEIISELKNSGIHLKILTGDHKAVALNIAAKIGLSHSHLITSEELRNCTEMSLFKIVKEKNIFAEIDPFQKQQIIMALRKQGFTVGFLGDGINDVAALHCADVGISVDTGAEAAKNAADIVLLEKDLRVLKQGVFSGRKTFSNTLKYIFMATSANFGNMFSMAGASLFLPFLPLLPQQVLLTNFFTDLPEMAIATDHVDSDSIAKPTHWDLKYIRKFMLLFGLLSSIFDYATFGILKYYLHADEYLFRSGWFLESVMSASLVVLVIRSKHLLIHSKPSITLSLAICSTVLLVQLLPYTPLGTIFGFVPIPWNFYPPLFCILLLYLLMAEGLKYLLIKNSRKNFASKK